MNEELLGYIGIGVVVLIALGLLVWLSWPSKIDLDRTAEEAQDEHGKYPGGWW